MACLVGGANVADVRDTRATIGEAVDNRFNGAVRSLETRLVDDDPRNIGCGKRKLQEPVSVGSIGTISTGGSAVQLQFYARLVL